MLKYHRGFKIEKCNSEQLRNSFFVKTVIGGTTQKSRSYMQRQLRVLKPSYNATFSLPMGHRWEALHNIKAEEAEYDQTALVQCF